MTETDLERPPAKFDRAIAHVFNPDAAWKALQNLTGAVAGFKLFTVMTVDLANEAARRAYTSYPLDYPVSGTRPIRHDDWFDIVHRRHKLFVANTIEDIAKVFPDHGKIRALGRGSAVNLPVVIAGHPAATINMPHHQHHYGAERIEPIQRHLSLPAQRAGLAARQFEG